MECSQQEPGLPVGEERVGDELLPLVYEELHRLAQAKMATESPGHTLQPTAFVHEAYLRLIQGKNARWRSRGAFFGAAAEAMRRILIERARRYKAVKHGAGRRRVPLSEAHGSAIDSDVDLEALDSALDALEENDPRAAKVVKLRYFVGLSIQETAEILEISPRTVQNDWTMSKTWLRDRLRWSVAPDADDVASADLPPNDLS